MIARERGGRRGEESSSSSAAAAGASRKKNWKLKKVVKRLLAGIKKLDADYPGKEELIKVRAFFRWVVESIRFVNIPSYPTGDFKVQQTSIKFGNAGLHGF